MIICKIIVIPKKISRDRSGKERWSYKRELSFSRLIVVPLFFKYFIWCTKGKWKVNRYSIKTQRASLNYIFYNLIFYLFIFHFKSKCLDEIRLSCHWLARQGVNSVPTRWTLPERFSTSSTSSSNFLLIFKSFILFFFFKEVNHTRNEILDVRL